MASDSLSDVKRFTERFLRIGIVLLVVSAAVVVFAVVLPISVDVDSARSARPASVQPLSDSVPDTKALVARLAGQGLIKPAQVQAAVRDTGAAQRLGTRLTLQGVVQIAGEWVAYIAVRNDGVKAVRKNDTVLEFVVKDVEPGKVILELDDGVVVQLRH